MDMTRERFAKIAEAYGITFEPLTEDYGFGVVEDPKDSYTLATETEAEVFVEGLQFAMRAAARRVNDLHVEARYGKRAAKWDAANRD